jgi:hypothetical protein
MDSTHHERFAGVPKFFQVSEHPVSAERKTALPPTVDADRKLTS